MNAAPVEHPSIPVFPNGVAFNSKHRELWFLVDRTCRFYFSSFKCWFSGVEKKALSTAITSSQACAYVVKRKHLGDLVDSLRGWLVITTALSQIKSPYRIQGSGSKSNSSVPDRGLAGLGVPFVTTETHELERRSSPRTSIRFTSMTGLRSMITGGPLPMTIFRRE
jgi:hypothetical protein